MAMVGGGNLRELAGMALALSGIDGKFREWRWRWRGVSGIGGGVVGDLAAGDGLGFITW